MLTRSAAFAKTDLNSVNNQSPSYAATSFMLLVLIHGLAKFFHKHKTCPCCRRRIDPNNFLDLLSPQFPVNQQRGRNEQDGRVGAINGQTDRLLIHPGTFNGKVIDKDQIMGLLSVEGWITRNLLLATKKEYYHAVLKGVLHWQQEATQGRRSQVPPADIRLQRAFVDQSVQHISA